MKRREFLEIVATCATVSAASLGSSGTRREIAQSAPVTTRRIDVVIYDARYVDAERFASTLTRDGARALATAGEIVTLWREELASRANVGELWIAGLTQHSDFEIARGLGASHGLRVFHRQPCAPRPADAPRAGTLTSWLLG